MLYSSLVSVHYGRILVPVHDRAHEVAYSSVTRDVEFQLSKSFEVSNTVTHPDLSERSAQHVVDGVGDFLPEGVERVTDVDVYVTELSITISQIHVIEDRDFGSGEVYLNLRLNDYDNEDYTFDNGGNCYVVNDGDYLDVDLTVSTVLHSMDGGFCIEGHGWESDVDYDDYMGGDILWYNLQGHDSYSASGWWVLDDFPPDGGNYDVQIEFYVDIQFTNIDMRSYPDEFTTPADVDGSWLISAVYFPKVHYDTFDSAHDVLIKEIYQQVYYGYDPSIEQNAYLIYYLFYWDYETDNFGANFGHYYDYEPLLMFVKEIGTQPYRIVYRDVGANTLPPRLVIQASYASGFSGVEHTDVSVELTPLLGDSCNVTYQITDAYFTTPAYHYNTDHGLSPYMTVPHLTITNTYHQMEVGIPVGSGDAVLSPLQDYLLPLSNEVISLGYVRLDEAFDSPVNVYEGVSLWNGGDYRVPEKMSLTLDMLQNPFSFPYIIDCWEDVVHYTEAKQDYRENGVYYDISLGLSFIVPATVTLTVPTTVTAGESYEMAVDLAIDANELIIKFDYDISLGFVLHWWFIGLEEDATYDGSMEFAVDLDAIADTLSALGFASDQVSGDYHQDWFTVSSFSTSTNLLSNMLDCTVRIHLLQILLDLLGTSGVGGVIKLLKVFLSDVDLVAHPTISGHMTANIETENSAISLDTTSITIAEDTTHHSIGMSVLGGETQSGVSLNNIQYHLAFAADWSVDLDFTDTMNNFVEDSSCPLGTFPDITESSDDHDISAETSTGYAQKVAMTVQNPPPSTTTSSGSTGTSSTTSGTTSAAPTDSPLRDLVLPLGMGMALGIAALVVIVVIWKRKESG
jgi:hypothetical protein